MLTQRLQMDPLTAAECSTCALPEIIGHFLTERTESEQINSLSVHKG